MTPAEHLSALRKIRAACAQLKEAIRDVVPQPITLLNEVDRIRCRVEYYADKKLLASQSAQLNALCEPRTGDETTETPE